VTAVISPSRSSLARCAASQVGLDPIPGWALQLRGCGDQAFHPGLGDRPREPEPCRNVPTTKVAHAQRYLYDHRPAMSLRAIGATPEVDLHHDNVGKIRDGATAVFGTAPGGVHR
jgi:hypothetical protein